MTKFLPFVYDKHQFFTNDKSFILTGNDLEYLTAFFNSSLFKFAFKDYFPELLGETRELRKVFFETISVMTSRENEWFSLKLNEIEQNKKEGVSTLFIEKEIDEKIFDLYELTERERSLIVSGIGNPSFSLELTSAKSLEESV